MIKFKLLLLLFCKTNLGSSFKPEIGLFWLQLTVPIGESTDLCFSLSTEYVFTDSCGVLCLCPQNSG